MMFLAVLPRDKATLKAYFAIMTNKSTDISPLSNEETLGQPSAFDRLFGRLADYWPVVTFLISAALLGGAYAFQYIGGLNPCQMCYWQRHAHKAVMAASALAILLTIAAPALSGLLSVKRVALGLIMLAFLLSFGLAFWHVGVEYGWLEGPKSCAVSAVTSGGFSVDSLQDALNKPIEAPACSDVAWSMLGLSMAGWNAVISLMAALMTIFMIRKA